MERIYYAEQICSAVKKNGERCKNKAYYEPSLCGVHCRTDRVELPKNPKAKEIKEEKLNDHDESVEAAAERNRENNLPGKIRMTRMKMRKEIPMIEGYLNIFPNYRHGNRKDGLGMPSLSPFNLGPVEHGEPEFPPAKCIENYYQFSKVFPDELDDEGKIAEEFYSLRKEMFLSDKGHRHKVKGVKPLFSVYFDSEGKEKRYGYIESRKFYCSQYQKLASKTAEFKKLTKLVNNGYNINIIGYDAHSDLTSEEENLEIELKRRYEDASRPFGHEIMLFTMLTIEKTDYPFPLV